MTFPLESRNQVRQRRLELNMTQAQLADQAGISRTAVTAIEGNRLVPSVASALALAAVLKTSVEELFARSSAVQPTEVWAWKGGAETTRCWRADVSGRTVIYPASASPMLAMIASSVRPSPEDSATDEASETLVMACCDPAAGLLASLYAAVTGLRLIVLPRSSRQAIRMLQDGLVHLAGLHFSTREEPDRNFDVIHETLGTGFQSIRLSRWQEGIVVRPEPRPRTVDGLLKTKLRWVGREAGSGARQCYDRLTQNGKAPRHLASDHRGVVEAVKAGWADAGICVQLASAEAGLDFLPLQEEAFDVCFRAGSIDDRRIKAFIKVVRSTAYREMIGELPGYDVRETGEIRVCQ
ncbi:substrate-binding domain-containing protein [Schlesneria sp.]|uniref:substrate-binding domain-containing protein n=1 Tax=Schlesneria sp. TaxID=2762018 RepID=UPI002EE7283E